MDKEIIHIQTKRIEKSLSHVSAKLADAETLLIEARQEIEELYISLDEREELD